MGESDRTSFSTEPTSSTYRHQLIALYDLGYNRLTDPVNVGLDIRPESALRSHVRYIIVDHHVDLLDIDTPRNYVCRDENLGLAVPEAIEDIVSLVRLFLAMQRSDLMPEIGEFLGDKIGCGSSLFISFALKRLA